MTSSDRYSLPGAAFVVKRALASVASPAVFISVLALLVIAVAACADDDDGTPSGSGTASPTSSLSATASPSPSDNGNGNGNGQVTPTPGASPDGEPSPSPNNTGEGTATIDGVQYDFSVSTCAIQPDFVFVVGFGTAPDGNPLIGSVMGAPDAIEVGIGTNASSILDLPEQVFKLGSLVAGSTVESVDIDVTGFDLTVTGMFVDLQAPEAPPVPGTFSVSCT